MKTLLSNSGSIGSDTQYSKFLTAAPKDLRPTYGAGSTTVVPNPWHSATLEKVLAENYSLTQRLANALLAIETKSGVPERNLDTLHASDMTKEVVNGEFLARMKSWPKPAMNQTLVVFNDDLGE